MRNTRRRTESGREDRRETTDDGEEAVQGEASEAEALFEAEAHEVEEEFERRRRTDVINDMLAEEYATYVSDDENRDQPEVDEAVADEELEEEAPQEESNARSVKCPGSPSKEEVAHHNLTHWPHRSWCPVCVKARSRLLMDRTLYAHWAPTCADNE